VAERTDWRAVGIGVAVGLAGTLLLGMVFRLMQFDVERHGPWLIHVFSYGAGAVVDIACGATAGALARRRGALHGVLAGLGASLASPVVGYVTMLVQGHGTAPIELDAYLLAIAFSSGVGIVLATVAGAIAAPIAARARGRADPAP
jgi:hypothetical protein